MKITEQAENLRPFINGEFVPSQSGKTMDIFDPSTGDVIAPFNFQQ